MYLIRFEYYRYEGAYEWQHETVLVHCDHTFLAACDKIKKVYGVTCKNFENLTIEFESVRL
jgi:hypothetical protein